MRNLRACLFCERSRAAMFRRRDADDSRLLILFRSLWSTEKEGGGASRTPEEARGDRGGGGEASQEGEGVKAGDFGPRAPQGRATAALRGTAATEECFVAAVGDHRPLRLTAAEGAAMMVATSEEKNLWRNLLVTRFIISRQGGRR